MQKGGIFNLRRLSFFEVISKNRLLILLSTLFLIGVVAGSISVGRSNELTVLAEKAFRSLYLKRANGSFASIFFAAFCCYAVYTVAACAVGTSMLGTVLAPVLVLWRGFLLGMQTALLYSQYALKGVAFNAIILIPPAVFSVIALIFGAKAAIAMSVMIAKLTFPGNTSVNLFYEFRSYCLKFTLLLIPTFISALADAALSNFFIGFFDLI